MKRDSNSAPEIFANSELQGAWNNGEPGTPGGPASQQHPRGKMSIEGSGENLG